MSEQSTGSVLTERVVLTVDSPRQAMPGLAQARTELESLLRQTRAVNRAMSDFGRTRGNLTIGPKIQAPSLDNLTKQVRSAMSQGVRQGIEAGLRSSQPSIEKAMLRNGWVLGGSIRSKQGNETVESNTFTRNETRGRRAVTISRSSGGGMSASQALNPMPTYAPINNRDLVSNTRNIAAWASGAMVLYGSLGLAKKSLESLVKTGQQTARLSVVFNGVGGTAAQLRDDILSLAAAYSRSTEEAIEASISWSRMGLTRQQVSEAVRVSLQAANVAEMSAAEATEHLSAIMLTYQLRVGELSSVLGQLNSISNTYSVTNKDMLTGISRVSSVAKQAGMPLSELMGLLGATVGATRQSGANIGNALKSIITAVGNPAIQELLRSMKVEVKTNGGDDLKDMSQIMSELYVRYQQLTDAERSWLLFRMAGKTQSSRMASMLDSYVKSQVLAINAQLNLNSAEKENQIILQSLGAQLQGITAEWERFVALQGSKGPTAALTQITMAFKNLLGLLNSDTGSNVFAGLLAVLTVASARIALTSMSMKAAAGSAGFLAASASRLRDTLAGLSASAHTATVAYLRLASAKSAADKQIATAGGVAIVKGGLGPIDSAIRKLEVWGLAASRVSKSATVTSASVRGLFTTLAMTARVVSSALTGIVSFAGPLILIGGSLWALNRVMEALGRSSIAADRAMAGFTAESERASKAASAYAQSVKLIQTAEKVLSNPKTSMDERRKWLENLKLMNIGSPELTTAVEGGDAPNVSRLLNVEKDKKRLQSADEAQKAYVAKRDALARARKDLERLENLPTASDSARQAARARADEASGQFVKA